jgi:leucyl aminopeptidase
MKIGFSEPSLPKSGVVVAFSLADRALGPTARRLDEAAGGIVAKALAGSRFAGKAGETLAVALPAGAGPDRLLLVGLGAADKADALAAQSAGGALAGALNRAGETDAAVVVDAFEGAKLDPAAMAAEMAFGARLAAYRFDRYRTKLKPEQKPTLKKLSFGASEASAAKKAFQRLDKVADGVWFCRDLVNEPGNVVYPETLADRCRELEALGVEVEILDEKRMAKLGMGALLGVARGSARPPRMICMVWNGAPDAKDKRPLALVGKGVTFDTGGISLKPGAGMWDMKWDMGGAGAVIGAMRAIAGRKAKANVVAVVGAVENMPDGDAQRPGDIVTSMSGQTIEVLNTDAEGRLVLADAIWYAQKTYRPRAIVDLATLTGAIMIALGTEQAGLFANDDDLAAKLQAAGAATGDKLWRMPLSDAYDRMIDADQADMKNIAGDRNAGSVVGAQFIQRFVEAGVPWAHLDVAGTVWSSKDAPTAPKGATGYGVRLLDRLVADAFEG